MLLELLLSAILLPPTGLAPYDYTTLYTYTGEQRTLSWDHDGSADRFEVNIQHVERKTVTKYTLPATDRSVEFAPQHVGHYIFEVCACNEVCTCAQCTDPAVTTTAHPRGFWLFAWLPPPTDGGIE